MILVFFIYVVLMAALAMFESARIRQHGPDLFTCFLGLFAIQTIVPASAISGILAAGPPEISIGRAFFQRVFYDLSPEVAMQLLVLTIVFVVTLYLTFVLVCGKTSKPDNPLAVYEWRVSLVPWYLIVAAGAACCILLLTALGGGAEGYVRLIQFRAGDPSVPRTFVTANLFSLTQTFSLIVLVGAIVLGKRRRHTAFWACVLLAIGFSVMTASRRALFVQLMLVYFFFVIENRRLYIARSILPIGLVAVPIVMYGKQFLASIAFGSRIDFSDLGLASAVRTFMDFGITNVESWATLMYLNDSYRFGVDHVLSVGRRIPDGLLGLNIQFPERVVRASTEVFVGKHEPDLPPGFFGQMWLDWGYFGPLVWGVLFGLQLAILQKAYDSIRTSPGMKMVFVLLLFLIALPVNTGSFDFTFNVSMFILIVFLAMVARFTCAEPSAGLRFAMK